MKMHGSSLKAAICVLAAGLIFVSAPGWAIDASNVPLTRLDQIRVEAAELKQKAQGASPAELRQLDERARELLREVGKKYPKLLPKSPVRRGRVVRVKQSPAARFGKKPGMQKAGIAPMAMTRPRLRVKGLSASSVVGEGVKIKLTLSVRNEGTGPAKKGSAEFAVTCDRVGSAGSCPFPSERKVSLWQDVAPGKSASYIMTAKKGAVAGKYKLEAALAGGTSGRGMTKEITVKAKRSVAPVQRRSREEEPPPVPLRPARTAQ